MRRPEGTHAAPKLAGSQRSRKIRALLASGLVLGVGATLTLASWNDSEYVGAELEAGSFGIQGSPAGPEGFRSSSEGSPHSLEFAPNSDTMFPGVSTYAMFSVRTDPGSIAGTIELQRPEWDEPSPNLAAYLQYGIRLVDDDDDDAEATCDQRAFESSDQIVVGETPLTSEIQVEPQTIAGNAEETLNYCLRLTLPAGTSNDAQDLSVTPQWQFIGTSATGE